MKLKIGDWILAPYRGDVVEGFVTRIFPEDMSCVIYVTRCEINKKLHRMDVDFSRIMQINNPELDLDDVDSLIDLALMTRDEEWFRDLVYAKERWGKSYYEDQMNQMNQNS